MSEIEQKCLSLSKEERERLIQVLTNSLNEAKLSLDEIHDAIVKVVGFEFVPHSRSYYQVVSRIIFVHFAISEGYTESKIGEYLSKNHSTVHQMKNRVKDWLSYPQYYGAESIWVELVRKKLYETE